MSSLLSVRARLSYAALLLLLTAALVSVPLPVSLVAADPPASAIEKALDKKVTVDFLETPLADAVEYFRDLLKINVVIDRRALENAGVPLDHPLTLGAKNVSLRSALRLLLPAANLDYAIYDEYLSITTPDVTSGLLVERTYEVGDLIHVQGALGDSTADPEELVRVIEAVVAPNTWEAVGGPASHSHYRGTLVVSQTRDVHELLKALLAAIRDAKAAQAAKPGGKVLLVDEILQQTAEAPIRAALDKETLFEFVDTPIADVMRFVAEMHHVPVQFDKRALEDAGLATDTPVNINLSNISLRAALHVALRSVNMTSIVKNESLVVTSQEQSDAELTIRVYPVRDLVAAADPETYDELTETIEKVVQPHTWSSVGGPGSVASFLNAGVLVISQTPAIHDEVERMLTSLRKSREGRAAPQVESALKTTVYTLAVEGDDVKELMQFLKEEIEPQSWKQPDRMVRVVAGQLIIRQTPDIQRRIKRLLEKLGVATPTDSSSGIGAFGRSTGGGQGAAF